MTVLTHETTAAYADRRRRAGELGQRNDHLQEVLRLYLAIVDVQERACERARADRPAAGDLADYVVRVALPGVMEATVAAGTETLREAALLRFHEGDLEGIVEAWLEGEDQSGTDTFLARASTSPVLEALPDVAATLPGERDERHCPTCGGAPQLAFTGDSTEALVTPQRKLVCSRCATEWAFARMTCAGCGESSGAKLPILADVDVLPHLRLDACEICRRYLVTVDARKEPLAVPLVDELAALPLDLAAAELGYTKIARNLMGF